MRVPIEIKVIASATATAGAGVAIAALNAIEADNSLLGPLPAWAQAPLIALVPPALAFLAGYRARHTPRSDAAARASVDVSGV
ncbi:holin [Kitasatospora cineracea]|uniref:Holin n=1 Tax=Kitasatospora cineracea TaxID=88074 RepID=A0A3N4RVV2_9ACTN|nr:holin [Kitasatospora cineracea]RPE34905.1 hypothetical protein EDD38_3247 [Kitasatospora cineracea]